MFFLFLSICLFCSVLFCCSLVSFLLGSLVPPFLEIEGDRPGLYTRILSPQRNSLVPRGSTLPAVD